LSNSEVNQLATQIVAQIKLRGPFLSMADFLNRRLGVNTSALSRCGALQAAIDSSSLNAVAKAAGSAVSIVGGAGLPGGGTPVGSPNGGMPAVISGNLLDVNGAMMNSATGIPGYLMQQDLVQAFSPVMAARSDTFIVRCYGESLNPASQAVEGQAWGEAVVQRLPEYVDQTDNAYTKTPAQLATATGNATLIAKYTAYTQILGDSTPAELTSATNQTFGRKFKIVSFRWLNKAEL
jgi:hypothetical protein